MVVGWYHSHPGFGCWLSGVDINTQQVSSFPILPSICCFTLCVYCLMMNVDLMVWHVYFLLSKLSNLFLLLFLMVVIVFACLTRSRKLVMPICQLYFFGLLLPSQMLVHNLPIPPVIVSVSCFDIDAFLDGLYNFVDLLQSFEALNPRAIAVVVDPIQSVKGKVVIDAFRLINPQTMMLGQEPRQTTSNVGHLNKPSIQVECWLITILDRAELVIMLLLISRNCLPGIDPWVEPALLFYSNKLPQE